MQDIICKVQVCYCAHAGKKQFHPIPNLNSRGVNFTSRGFCWRVNSRGVLVIPCAVPPSGNTELQEVGADIPHPP